MTSFSTTAKADKKLMQKLATVAFDLDGTLAHQDDLPFDPKRIGKPIPKMIAKLKEHQQAGDNVVIFTARASDPANVKYVEKWLRKYQLNNIKVTNQKTPDIEKFYDDRAISIEKNTGKIKSAADPEPLLPHQVRLINRLLNPGQPGIIAQHGTGLGKTRESIEAWKALGQPPATVVVPAALKANYQKELMKWVGKVPSNMNIVSQQLIAREGDLGKYNTPGMLIVDESHKARESSSKLIEALQTSRAKKKLLLSGTPIYNHPKDISTLINLAAGKNLLPTSEAGFNDRYIEQKQVNPSIIQSVMGVKPGIRPVLKNTNELQQIFKKYIDYQPGLTKGLPRSTEKTVTVPMGSRQTDVYKAIMGKAPWWVRWKVRAGLPPGKGELDKLRAFLTGARQVSNTDREFVRSKTEDAAKIQAAFKFFNSQLQKDPNYKAVIYSNYINSGLNPYKDLLTKANIPYGEFSGQIAKSERDELVKQYNANQLKALLVSSAGAEGLDLKATRLIQLLDPSWNLAKEKQIIGRGIRFGSHADLPPEKQHVLIQHYLAQPQAGWFDRILGKETLRGTDEYINNIAKEKELLNDQIKQLLTPPTRG